MAVQFRNRVSFLCLAGGLLVMVALGASAQSLPVGPMGLIQGPQPALKSSRSIRAVLPKGTEARMVIHSELTASDMFVLYEFDDWFEPDPVLIALQKGRTLGRWRLPRLLDTDRDYVFLEGRLFRLTPQQEALAVAFRNIGDGSGTLLFVLSAVHGKYKVLLKESTFQGRLEVDEQGRIRVWNGELGEECVWCRHRYEIKGYRWTGTRLVLSGRKLRTRHSLDPQRLAAKPIVIAQHPVTAI